MELNDLIEARKNYVAGQHNATFFAKKLNSEISASMMRTPTDNIYCNSQGKSYERR
jgi:hypothetical protein